MVNPKFWLHESNGIMDLIAYSDKIGPCFHIVSMNLAYSGSQPIQYFWCHSVSNYMYQNIFAFNAAIYGIQTTVWWFADFRG